MKEVTDQEYERFCEILNEMKNVLKEAANDDNAREFSQNEKKILLQCLLVQRQFEKTFNLEDVDNEN